jgi:hypothetical protein
LELHLLAAILFLRFFHPRSQLHKERAMAKVVRFHKVGGPEVLQLDEVEVAPPKQGEIQIRVNALGLNRAESMFRS